MVLQFHITTPDDWTMRETLMIQALVDAFCRIRLLEAKVDSAIIDIIKHRVAIDTLREEHDIDPVPADGTTEAEAAAVVQNHSAVQSGIDLLKSMFPGVQIRAIV